MGIFATTVPKSSSPIVINPQFYTATTAAAITLSASSSQVYDLFSLMNDGNGKYVTYEFYVPSGTYTLKYIYAKSAGGGIVDISIDGTDISTGNDTYAAATTYNQIITATGISLSRGLHTLKLTMNGKNGASSGYALYSTMIFLIKTA